MTLVEMLYKDLIRPRLFEMSKDDAELGHEWGISQMEFMQRIPGALPLARKLLAYHHPVLESFPMGMKFPNPLGLAAGFDKYCRVYWGAAAAMGWGFVEVGGITPLPQGGNARPRMWRSERHQSLCNAMGFNNPGKDDARRALVKHKCPIPLVLNIGKGKDTPLDRAAEDYVAVLEDLWLLVDCITINVSSPNTKDLRNLQVARFLAELLSAVQEANKRAAMFYRLPCKKLGVKISPDETDEQYSDIVSAAVKNEFDYLICANTTLDRPAVLADVNFPNDRGGVSGQALKDKARHVLDVVYKEVRGRLVLISVGAINSADELYYRILHGANLCQSLTALPFEGPDFPKRTLKRLVTLLGRDGFGNVNLAVGAAVK